MANEIKKINKIFLVPLLPNDLIPSTFFFIFSITVSSNL